MAVMGNFSSNEFSVFQRNLNRLSDQEKQAFIESCARELAARLLRKVIGRTPVGRHRHRVGGTLKRGWTGGVYRADVATYVNSLNVVKNGGLYTIEIINPVYYAPYVEYGHRTRNHRGWVNGRSMLTISEQEIQSQMPSILENKLRRRLGGLF